MQNSLTKPKLHLWVPNIFEFKGGIQVYSAFFIKALQHIFHDSVEYEIFLKHDTHALAKFPLAKNTQFHFTGTCPLPLRTGAFVADILGHGLVQRPSLAIATHLNFTVAAYWLKRLAGIPYWTVAHGVEAWNIQRPVLQNALRHADRILAVSNYTRDRLLQEQSLDPSKISLLPNTFAPERFKIDEKPLHLLKQYHLQPKQPIILTVSRLHCSAAYKGYEKILEALPRIRQIIPNIHYIIVGKGDDRPRIEQLIEQHQLQECVTLAGFIPDAELCDYYNLCDVFAMPSKREGFGIVYLEALACGKPTLGGNKDGAVDALRYGELGALVDPDDVGAIAENVIQILQGTYPNPLIYQPEALRQKVIEYFGFEQFKKTLAIHLERHFISNQLPKTSLDYGGEF